MKYHFQATNSTTMDIMSAALLQKTNAQFRSTDTQHASILRYKLMVKSYLVGENRLWKTQSEQLCKPKYVKMSLRCSATGCLKLKFKQPLHWASSINRSFFRSTFLLWFNIHHLFTGPVLQNNLLNKHVPSNHGHIACHAFRMHRENHPSEQLLLQRSQAAFPSCKLVF